MTPTVAQRLDALADALEAGATLAEALGDLERVGGRTGTWARRFGSLVRGGATFAGAIGQARALRPTELALVRAVERHGALAPALRRVAAARRAEAARRREILRGGSGPFVALVLTILVLPLPDALLGGDYFAFILPALALLGGGVALALLGLPALVRHPRSGPPALAVLVRLPGLGRLVRAHVEAEIAAVQAALVAAGMSANAAHREAASIVSWRRPAPMPTVSVAKPADVGIVATVIRRRDARDGASGLPAECSEAFRLALAAGERAGDLPRRLAAWSAETADSVTARLRTGVRVVLLGTVLASSLWGLHGLLETQTALLGPAGELPLEVDPSQLRDLEALDALLRDMR